MLNLEEIIKIYIRKHKLDLSAMIEYQVSITQPEIYAMTSITQKSDIENEICDFLKNFSDFAKK